MPISWWGRLHPGRRGLADQPPGARTPAPPDPSWACAVRLLPPCLLCVFVSVCLSLLSTHKPRPLLGVIPHQGCPCEKACMPPLHTPPDDGSPSFRRKAAGGGRVSALKVGLWSEPAHRKTRGSGEPAVPGAGGKGEAAP